MKNILIALFVLLVSVLPVQAQTYLDDTTTTAALTASSTDNVVALASVTGVAVGGYLYIDHELMQVRSINGLRVTVNRATAPAATKPAAHGSGSVVYVANAARAAVTMLPSAAAQRAGRCVLSDYQYLPIIDVETGDMYACRYAASGSTFMTWLRLNVQGLNGAGSITTAWP